MGPSGSVPTDPQPCFQKLTEWKFYPVTPALCWYPAHTSPVVHKRSACYVTACPSPVLSEMEI